MNSLNYKVSYQKDRRQNLKSNKVALYICSHQRLKKYIHCNSDKLMLGLCGKLNVIQIYFVAPILGFCEVCLDYAGSSLDMSNC